MSNMRWSLLIIGGVILLGIYLYGRWRSQSRGSDVFSTSLREEPDILLNTNGKGTPVIESNPVLKRQLDSLGQVGQDQLRNTLDHGAKNEPVAEEKKPKSLADKPAVSPPTPTPAPAVVKKPEPKKSAVEEAPKAEPAVVEKLAETKNAAEKAPEKSDLKSDDEVIVIHIVAPTGKPFSGRAVLKVFHANALRYGDMNIFHRMKIVKGEQIKVFSLASMVKPGTLDPKAVIKSEMRGLSLFTTLPNEVGNIVAYDEMLHCAQHMATTLNGELRDQKLRPMTHGSIMIQRSNLRKRYPS